MKIPLLILLIVFSFFSCNQHTIPKTEIKKENISLALHVLPNLPKEINFCGQIINLEDEDIRERLDREILVNAYYQSSTLQILKRANRFFPEIEKILRKNKIPEDFKYLAVIESGLIQAFSPAGAKGFWQFMPGTAKDFNLRMTNEVDERLNIEKSTISACAYLNVANDTLKDWILSAASYNRGIGGVRSDMRWQRTDNYFDTYMNSETGRYVFRILAVKLIFENPEKYGYDLKKVELYKPYETYSIIVRSTINNLAEWAINKGINYKILIKLNPWILSNKLSVKGDFFKVSLPLKKFNLKPYKKYQ